MHAQPGLALQKVAPGPVAGGWSVHNRDWRGGEPKDASGGREGMIPSRTLREGGSEMRVCRFEVPVSPVQGARGE